MQSDVSLGEKQERLDAIKTRVASLTEVRTKLRKLNHALVELAVVSPKKQIGLIKAALRYVNEMDVQVPAVKPVLVMVTNELQSLREGVLAKVVQPSDMVLTSGINAVKTVDELLAKAKGNVVKLEAAIGDVSDLANEALIRKNQAAKEKIPAFNGKEYVVGRAPVAFTFVNKQKHSSVGYVDQEMLSRLGFKSDNLGGYTILHNQLVVGIDAAAVYDTHVDENGTRTQVRKRVKESVITFKAGRPTKVMKARERQHFDIALKVKKLIEQKTNTRYAFVSELGVGLNNGEFFWLMPAADVTRLAKAFPGGHAKINKWGFAF